MRSCGVLFPSREMDSPMKVLGSSTGMKWVSGLVACAVVVTLTSLIAARDTDVVQAQQTRPSAMALKLSLTQELLEKITMEQFSSIEETSNQLLKVSANAAWAQSRTEEYDLFASDFIRRVEQMREAARDGNLASVTLNYTSLIQTCVECHDAVRRRAAIAYVVPESGEELRLRAIR